MHLPETPDRVARHLAAFNAAIRSGEWAAFADRFTPGATMAFTAVPAGPFTGRAAIAAAYADQPPDDTMAIRAVTSAGPVDTVSFAWTAGGTGTMRLTWESGLVARLDVSFD
jgi:steroid delta-isomerase